MTSPETKERLYGDRPAPGRPTSKAPYSPPRLSSAPASTTRVLLFTIDRPGGEQYKGTIPDPLPARHYAQMLLDAVDLGVIMAETKMVNAVLGTENLRALAECDGLDPAALTAILAEAFDRAMGPYRAVQGNSQAG